MAIKIKCPECGTEYNVRDERAGQTGRCRCGNLISIPSEEAPCMAESPKAARKPRRGIFVGLGIVLCAAGSVLAGYTATSPAPIQIQWLVIGLALIFFGIGVLIAASR